MTTVATGYREPVDVVVPPDGSQRLFVVERHGLIRVVQNGKALDTPFLDLTAQVATETWEQAEERAVDGRENKGWEAAAAAIEMAVLFRRLRDADRAASRPGVRE